MRKIILVINISIDGYVEGSNKDISWMQPDDEYTWESLFDLIQHVDLFLLGSGMWEDYRNHWTKVAKTATGSAGEKRYAALAMATRHAIFSSRLTKTGWSNAYIIGGFSVDAIVKLKQQPGGDIQVVGGAAFAAFVINSGLVDEYQILVHPVLLGQGTSLFQLIKTHHHLQPISTTKLPNGVSVLHYIAKRPPENTINQV